MQGFVVAAQAAAAAGTPLRNDAVMPHAFPQTFPAQRFHPDDLPSTATSANRSAALQHPSTMQAPHALSLPPLQHPSTHQGSTPVFFTAPPQHYASTHSSHNVHHMTYQPAHHLAHTVPGLHNAPQTTHQQPDHTVLHENHLHQNPGGQPTNAHQPDPPTQNTAPPTPHQATYRLSMPFVPYPASAEHVPTTLAPHVASVPGQPQSAESTSWMHSMIFEYQRTNARLRESLTQSKRDIETMRAKISELDNEKDKSDTAGVSGASAKQPRRYWTPEEHKRFLEAVRKFGQRDVRAISNYVGTRNPSQVRTHAQKFYLKVARLAERKGGLSKRSMSEGDLLSVGKEAEAAMSDKDRLKDENRDRPSANPA